MKFELDLDLHAETQNSIQPQIVGSRRGGLSTGNGFCSGPVKPVSAAGKGPGCCVVCAASGSSDLERHLRATISLSCGSGPPPGAG